MEKEKSDQENKYNLGNWKKAIALLERISEKVESYEDKNEENEQKFKREV